MLFQPFFVAWIKNHGIAICAAVPVVDFCATVRASGSAFIRVAYCISDFFKFVFCHFVSVSAIFAAVFGGRPRLFLLDVSKGISCVSVSQLAGFFW